MNFALRQREAGHKGGGHQQQKGRQDAQDGGARQDGLARLQER